MSQEIKRVRLMREAVERYADGDSLAEAIRLLDACADVSKWEWAVFDAV
jgi:hypothetical protein